MVFRDEGKYLSYDRGAEQAAEMLPRIQCVYAAYNSSGIVVDR